MSHTAGKLATNHDRVESKDDHGWINDGWIIAQCQGPDAVANARRLVACWNYCVGMTTERLEAGDDWKVEARVLLNNNRIVDAVKHCRAMTGWGLKEALDEVKLLKPEYWA